MRHCVCGRNHVRALIAFAALAWACTTDAQIAGMEVHALATQTMTTAEFLSGKSEGKRETIAGELRIPGGTAGDRLPAVILMHGSAGIGGNVQEWSLHLNEIGLATFVLDSFSGRGIARGANVPQMVRIIDAYRALDLLAQHPRIDPDRIAVMGFSHGGAAALYSTMKRFARMYGPTDGRVFAAHIVFYPSCFTAWKEREDINDRAVRIFHGAADDQLPVTACREYITKLRAAGKDVAITEYRGAGHAFDWRHLKEPLKLPKAASFNRCSLEEADGQVLSSSTRQPFSQNDPCVDRGSVLAYDAHAHSAAIKAVTDFVTGALKPK